MFSSYIAVCCISITSHYIILYVQYIEGLFSQRKNGYPWQEAAVREGDGEHEELLHKAEKLYLWLQEPCAFSVRICRRQVVDQTV